MPPTKPETHHLHPHAEVAERVLVPGDPGRALRIAQWLLDGPKMLNHHRGLWGYTGLAPDGAPLTVQSTGTGGPSAAIVCADLVALGAQRLVRVGTGTALTAGVPLGAPIVADPVLARDGASRALGAGREIAPDATLAAALAAATGPGAFRGPVMTADVLSVEDGEGALALDLESATVLAVAHRHGLAAAAVLVVAAGPDGARLEGDALEEAEQALGQIGLAALSVNDEELAPRLAGS